MFDLFLEGLTAVMTVKTILFILIGVAMGLVFGSIPGLTATMAIAIALPMTFGSPPLSRIRFQFSFIVKHSRSSYLTNLFIF